MRNQESQDKIVEDTMGYLTQYWSNKDTMSATIKLAKVFDELQIKQSPAECLSMVLLPGEGWLHAEMSSGPCRAEQKTPMSVS